MKTLNTTDAELSAPSTGVLIITAGTLPAKHATVTGEVLRRLLGGERLTGLDAVNDASTTRLAAVVHYLETAYNWTIKRQNKATGCKDGRVAFVSEYWIDAGTIAIAGADKWCEQVHAARRALRANAALAQKQAECANDAARRERKARARQRGQFGLFEGCAL